MAKTRPFCVFKYQNCPRGKHYTVDLGRGNYVMVQYRDVDAYLAANAQKNRSAARAALTNFASKYGLGTQAAARKMIKKIKPNLEQML